uniref:Reticulon-like protein n=1 Tax=Setaria digitata TaxID=48799 RepID=A0A915PQZ2_9BILA
MDHRFTSEEPFSGILPRAEEFTESVIEKVTDIASTGAEKVVNVANKVMSDATKVTSEAFGNKTKEVTEQSGGKEYQSLEIPSRDTASNVLSGIIHGVSSAAEEARSMGVDVAHSLEEGVNKAVHTFKDEFDGMVYEILEHSARNRAVFNEPVHEGHQVADYPAQQWGLDWRQYTDQAGDISLGHPNLDTGVKEAVQVADDGGAEQSMFDRKGPLTIPHQTADDLVLLSGDSDSSKQSGFELSPRPPTPPKELDDEDVKPTTIDVGQTAPFGSEYPRSILKNSAQGVKFNLKDMDPRHSSADVGPFVLLYLPYLPHGLMECFICVCVDKYLFELNYQRSQRLTALCVTTMADSSAGSSGIFDVLFRAVYSLISLTARTILRFGLTAALIASVLVTLHAAGQFSKRALSHKQDVLDIVYWRDPKKSGGILGISILMLLVLAKFPLIAVFSYAGLSVLGGTLGFRIYKLIEAQIKKTDGTNPYRVYLENREFHLPKEKVHQQVDALIEYAQLIGNELRRLFLAENIVESVKFGLLLWALTYVSYWFSGLSLLILGGSFGGAELCITCSFPALLAVFTIPKVYEVYQEPIDRNILIAKQHVDNINKMIDEKIPPFLKKSAVTASGTSHEKSH